MAETSWAFLIIGSLAAVGAALAFGTLAAILRYHRTGSLPGSDEPAELSPSRYVAMWARVVVGTGFAIAGVIAMQRAGLI